MVSSRTANKSFIRSINVSDGIRKSIRAAGFPWRPYVLRAYCDTQLLVAESKGKIIHSYRQFLMGHKGDIEARYTTNKNKLPENLIDDIRKAYKNSHPFLQTYNVQSEEERNNVFKRMILLAAGVPENEVDAMDMSSLEMTEIAQISQEYSLRKMTENGNRQKVVSSKQVKKYIESGWEFVTSLPDGSVIVKLPI